MFIWQMQRAVCGLMLGLSLHPAWAVMPPQYEAQAAWERIRDYQQRRDTAPDVVQMRVEQLQTSHVEGSCPQLIHWELQGKLLTVSRGDLPPGAVVQIRQDWADYRCPGPVQESIPTLAPGDETEAYLSCQPNGECELAAGNSSFVSQADFAAEVQARKHILDEYFPPLLVVRFKHDRIVPEGQTEVDAQLSHLCERLHYQRGKVIQLQGYTDSRGSSENCLLRSFRYVEWVKRKLLEAGCDAGRIRDKAYGKEKNDIHAPGMQGKPQNRVELNVF